jgi:peroxiredoxin
LTCNNSHAYLWLLFKGQPKKEPVMRVTLIVCLVWYAASFALAAVDDEAPSAQQEYDALVKAQRDAQTAFSRAYQAATTKEGKDKTSNELGRQSSAQSHSEGFAKLIEKYPNDPAALKALDWLMQRDPGSAATTRAVNALGDELLQSPQMVDLCWTLALRSGPSSERLLRILIEKSPHRDVQAQASFAQCSQLKSQLDRWRGSPASMVAARGKLEGLLAGVVEKYGDVKYLRGNLKDSAEAMLFEVQHLSVGQVAPDIEGHDLEGKPLRLSDYRGKVVLLVYWGTWCGPCMAAVPEHAALLQRMDGKPFAIVGVNSDADAASAHKIGTEKGITWRSWWDGGGTQGPIASRWNVHGWPTLYLLDAQGTIRFKGEMLRASSARRNAKGEFEQFRFIDDYADQLMKELEATN